MGRADNPVRGLRVLVTGAAGFIGSHLCERLVADGHGVWALDNFDPSYDPAVKRRNVAGISTHPCMRVVEGDVRDGVLLDGLLTSVPFDLVVHLAARTGERGSLAEPEVCWDVNVTGTLRLLEAMRRRHVSRLIFASSAAVYGKRSSASGPFTETDSIEAPTSPYGASKRAGELLCRTWHDSWGCSVHGLRLFEVYGPRQRPDQTLSEFARRLRAGASLRIDGGAEAKRDFIAVDDVVEGICRSVEVLRGRAPGEPTFELLNLGRGRAVRLAELAEALASAMGRKARTPHREGRPGGQEYSVADVSRAAATLGFHSSVGLTEGIDRYVAWLTSEGAEASPLESAVLPA